MTQMLDKVKSILSSVRFLQVTIVAALQILALYELVPQDLANVVSVYLGVVVTIGTVDKAAKSVSGKK